MSNASNERRIEPTEIIDFNKDVLLVSAAQAIPPGSRVLFSLKGSIPEGSKEHEYRGKLVSIRKTGEGVFELKLKLHSVTKEQRDALIR